MSRPPSPNPCTVRLLVWLPPLLARQVREAAEAAGVPVGRWCRRAVQDVRRRRWRAQDAGPGARRARLRLDVPVDLARRIWERADAEDRTVSTLLARVLARAVAEAPPRAT